MRKLREITRRIGTAVLLAAMVMTSMPEAALNIQAQGLDNQIVAEETAGNTGNATSGNVTDKTVTAGNTGSVTGSAAGSVTDENTGDVADGDIIGGDGTGGNTGDITGGDVTGGNTGDITGGDVTDGNTGDVTGGNTGDDTDGEPDDDVDEPAGDEVDPADPSEEITDEDALIDGETETLVDDDTEAAEGGEAAEALGATSTTGTGTTVSFKYNGTKNYMFISNVKYGTSSKIEVEKSSYTSDDFSISIPAIEGDGTDSEKALTFSLALGSVNQIDGGYISLMDEAYVLKYSIGDSAFEELKCSSSVNSATTDEYGNIIKAYYYSIPDSTLCKGDITIKLFPKDNSKLLKCPNSSYYTLTATAVDGDGSEGKIYHAYPINDGRYFILPTGDDAGIASLDICFKTDYGWPDFTIGSDDYETELTGEFKSSSSTHTFEKTVDYADIADAEAITVSMSKLCMVTDYPDYLDTVVSVNGQSLTGDDWQLVEDLDEPDGVCICFRGKTGDEITETATLKADASFDSYYNNGAQGTFAKPKVSTQTISYRIVDNDKHVRMYIRVNKTPQVLLFECGDGCDDLSPYDSGADSLTLVEAENGVYSIDRSKDYVIRVVSGHVETAIADNNYNLIMSTDQVSDAAYAPVSSSQYTTVEPCLKKALTSSVGTYYYTGVKVTPGEEDAGKTVTVSVKYNSQTYQLKLLTSPELRITHPSDVNAEVYVDNEDMDAYSSETVDGSGEESGDGNDDETGIVCDTYRIPAGKTIMVSQDTDDDEDCDAASLKACTYTDVNTGKTTKISLSSDGRSSIYSFKMPAGIAEMNTEMYMDVQPVLSTDEDGEAPLGTDGNSGSYTVTYSDTDPAENVYYVSLCRIADDKRAAIGTAKPSSKSYKSTLTESDTAGVYKLTLSASDMAKNISFVLTEKDTGRTFTLKLKVLRTPTKVTVASPAKTKKSGSWTYYEAEQGYASTVSYTLKASPALVDMTGIKVAVVDSTDESNSAAISAGESLDSSDLGDISDIITGCSLSEDGTVITVTTTGNADASGEAKIEIFNDMYDLDEDSDPEYDPGNDYTYTNLNIRLSDTAFGKLKPSASLNSSTDVSAVFNLGLPKNFSSAAYANSDSVILYKVSVTQDTNTRGSSSDTAVPYSAVTDTADGLDGVTFTEYVPVTAAKVNMPLMFAAEDGEAVIAGGILTPAEVGSLSGLTAFKACKYTAKISLVKYAASSLDENYQPEAGSSAYAESQAVSIKNIVNQKPKYETKLTFKQIKKTVYPGQGITGGTADAPETDPVVLAEPVFSKATTYRNLYSKDGAYSLTVAPADNKISAAAAKKIHPAVNSAGQITAYIDSDAVPGKYTISTYAAAENGAVGVSGKFTFTVAKDIAPETVKLNIPTTRLLKQNKKASTLKTTVTALCNTAGGSTAVKPAKTEWFLVPVHQVNTKYEGVTTVTYEMDNDSKGNPELCTSIRNGYITIKNGTVTVAKDYNPSSYRGLNMFAVCARITTLQGTQVLTYSDIVEVKSNAMTWSCVHVMKTSGGTETQLDGDGTVSLASLQGAKITAFTKYSEAGAETNSAVSSNLTYASNNKAVIVDSTGKITIDRSRMTKAANVKLTVTATDGSKKTTSITLKVQP